MPDVNLLTHLLCIISNLTERLLKMNFASLVKNKRRVEKPECPMKTIFFIFQPLNKDFVF